MQISSEHAKRFLLAKHYLCDREMLDGIQGIRTLFQSFGCFPASSGFDPELDLFVSSRVRNSGRDILDHMLYYEKSLSAAYDKGNSIIITDDMPCLEKMRKALLSRIRASESVQRVFPDFLQQLHSRITASDDEIVGILKSLIPDYAPESDRDTADSLVYAGILAVVYESEHTKRYMLAQDAYPEIYRESEPFHNAQERIIWHLCRRLDAIGLLNVHSREVFFGIDGLTPSIIDECIDQIRNAGWVNTVSIDGIDECFLILKQDTEILKRYEKPSVENRRVRILPQGDPLLWDRKLISSVFEFQHKVEIRTNRFLMQNLPVLYGDQFVGRIAMEVNDREKVLRMYRFYPESGFYPNDRFMWALEDALKQLQKFRGLNGIQWHKQFFIE